MDNRKLDKRFTALVAALCALAIATLAVQAGCCMDTEGDLSRADYAGTGQRAAAVEPIGTQPPTLPSSGDPPPDPACSPSVGSSVVVAACEENDFAYADGGFIAGATWQSMAGIRAVAVYCEYASVVVAPYAQLQVPAQISNSAVQAKCNGAHFVHFFAP